MEARPTTLPCRESRMRYLESVNQSLMVLVWQFPYLMAILAAQSRWNVYCSSLSLARLGEEGPVRDFMRDS